MQYLTTSVALLLLANSVLSQNIVLTNDDGWAVAQIRAQYNALNAAGFNVRPFCSTFYVHRHIDNYHLGCPVCPRRRRVGHGII